MEIINEGVNGRSIPRLDWEIESAAGAVCRSEAEAIVVMLGSNDLLQCPSLSAKICAARMEEFLVAFLAEAPANLKVLLVAPPPMSEGTWVSNPRILEESHRLAGCYKTVAHRLGIAFADAGPWCVGLAHDGVHFSEESHLAFAEGMRKALNTLL